MKAAFEQVFDGSLTEEITGVYDSTKINATDHCGQYNLGSGEVDKFIGPAPVGVVYLGESSLAIPSNMVYPIKISDDLWWIFANDSATAAATRRIQLITWVPSTQTLSLQGAITLTFPSAGAHTIRGFRVTLDNYTTGTVSASGTSVTGSGTAWTDSLLTVGSRIGFGSTNPNLITTWYQISSVDSNTGITLTSSAGTVSAGTAYVIQDIRIVVATTNGTLTNGGLFIVKGLRPEIFTSPITVTIPAATTVDNIRAVYWLKDAATVVNTAAGGSAIEDKVSWTEQYVYVPNGTSTSLSIYKYNIRAALTLTAGAATNAFTLVTGAQTVTGNIQQVNNGRVATVAHGPGAGVACVYLLTTSRVLRCPISSITSGSTTFVVDSMSETPPGGTNTNIGANSFSTFDVSTYLDRFIIQLTTSVGTAYITQYNATGAQFERRFGCLTSQLNSSNSDLDSPIYYHYGPTSTIPTVWAEEGWLFAVNNSTTANLNQLFVYPLAADWEYSDATGNILICPKITLGSTPAKFYRISVNAASNLGDNTLGVAPDSYRIFYRTSGIDDNAGSWTIVPQNGDLSGVSVSSTIQFAFKFRTAGVVGLPARILSLALVYETADALPSQYRWNFSDVNTSNGTFAWVQTSLFNTATLATHTIDIYRSDTNALVLTQASTTTTNGTFEYFGTSTWVAGLGGDSIGTRRRFVPTGSLPSGVNLYATITVG